MRSSIKVAVIGAQTRLRVGGIVDVLACSLCSLQPFIFVRIGPAAEQIDKCRQAIRGIAPSVVAICGLERGNVGLFAIQRATITLPTGFQNSLRIFHVFRIIPTVGSKQKRHHEVDFAVWSVALVTGRTVAIRLPREVAVATTGRVMP